MYDNVPFKIDLLLIYGSCITNPSDDVFRMSLAPLSQEAVAKASESSMLIAAKVNDFGGYTGPILGLLVIAVIIAVLTPPVRE